MAPLRQRKSKPEAGALHVQQIHEAERVVGAVEQVSQRLRSRARVAIGITGRADLPSMPEVFARAGFGWYTIVALGLLAAASQLLYYGLFVLGPDVNRTIAMSKGLLPGIGSFRIVNLSLATLVMAHAVHKHLHRRAAVVIAAAFIWSTMFGLAGLMTAWWGLLLVQGQEGQQAGSVAALHPSMLMDAYPPQGRFRALSFYYALQYGGYVLASVVVGLLVGPLNLTWRAVFIVFGVLSLAASVLAVKLRDPGFGRFDVERIRGEVAEDAGRSAAEVAEEQVRLGFFETVRRLLLVPTLRRIYTAQAVLGMMVVPLYTFLFTFLDQEWKKDTVARSVFFAVMNVFVIVALLAFARRGEALYRTDPAQLLHRAALFLAASSLAFSLAIFAPWFAIMGLLFGMALALIALLTPSLSLIVLSLVEPHARPAAAALSSVFLAAVGGTGGLLLLGGMDRRFGPPGAIIAFAVPGLIAAWVLRGAVKTVNEDIDRMIDNVVEDTELGLLAAGGAHLPMLACRGVDFSYGQLQVLFGVNFTVDDGEMVALLGTNGAGKSTLLRVISGLGVPSRGSVRFRGADITYLDAERRLPLGIAQVPGGRAVFGPLSVVENLRLFGYSHGRNRRALEEGIETCFEHFPPLAERHNQPAATLSGGEQQMLGVSKAFILKPRLLLIDELSLGLAPKIVADLLHMVRKINAQGTAVVLVEQSVNVALSLVQHAYFMEKGEIRFDGAADELLVRTDLLRSVFLEGATKVLAR